MIDDLEDDDHDDFDDRGLDEGQDPAERCADYGCEDDGLGRCMICDRFTPGAAIHVRIRLRRTARERLARTRARAKERRALMRGRREILRSVPMLRGLGYAVPRAVDLVRMVVVLVLGGQASAIATEVGFQLFFPLGRDDNEKGGLHCDGNGCAADRLDCDHARF